jgi:hypothetical protein
VEVGQFVFGSMENDAAHGEFRSFVEAIWVAAFFKNMEFFF